MKYEHADEESLIVTDFGEQYLYSANGDSFLPQPSSDIYRDRLSLCFSDNEIYHIVIGTDSGLLIQYVVNQGIPDKSCYLFVELEQYIGLVKPEVPLEWQNKLKFCTPEQFLTGFDEEFRMSYLFTDNIKVHRSIGVSDMHNPAYSRARIDVEMFCERMKLENELSFGSLNFIIKQLNNAAYNKHSSHELFKKFTGKTAIILAGGPSLDLDLAWIKENRQHLTVISVARISKRLIIEDIKPDIVVSVDPSQASYSNSKELLEFQHDTLFVNGNHINSQLLSQWQHQSMFVGNLLPWESSLNDNCSFAGGPTVSNIALVLAVNMGFDTVLLSGVDLCFDAQGKSHAAGSAEANKSSYISLQGQWIKTYEGRLAETTNNFSIAIKTLASQAKYALDNGTSVYNLSSSAACVENIEYISKSDVSLLSDKVDVLALVPQWGNNDERHYFNVLQQEFNKVNTDLYKIEKLAIEAIVQNEAIYDAKCEITNNQAVNKLKNIEKKLNNRFGYLTPLLKKIAIADFVKMLALQGVDNASQEEIKESTHQYYKSFISGKKILEKILVPANKRLQLKIQAQGKDPDIEQLITYWNDCGEFNALRVWMKHNPGTYEDVILLDLLKLEDEKFTKYHQTLDDLASRDNFSESELLSKIRTVYFDGHIIGIQLLITQLTLMKTKSENNEALVALANAYLSVLKSEKTAAIEYFELVPKELLSEHEYKLSASLLIDLERFDDAQIVLATLSNMLNVHLPLYAKILHINGETTLAIEAYSTFLEEYPKNTSVWFDLALLYLANNSADAAKMALEFILSIEPTHHSAMRLVTDINNGIK
jgi:hypothetical protein